jgi:L-histidine N-alpha-methyltransferase
MRATARARLQVATHEFGRASFAADVISGLKAERKRIPAKYFYDDRGSRLFEAITALPEYYPTRTELGILEANAAGIAKLFSQDAALVEFGSGSTVKARILLRAAPHVAFYVPVDISADFLGKEAASLKRDLPDLHVLPVAADFTKPFDLPAAVRPQPRTGFFPGSTIGNFEPHEATRFLRHVGKLLGPGAMLLVGVDLVKEPDVLHAAYNDSAGVTAAFNLNLLHRINRELAADFDVDAFRHRAFYDSERRRIEMHLESLAAQDVRVCGETIRFRPGETIHTENSYKYSVESFRALAEAAGWYPRALWTDAREFFSVHALLCETRPAES